MKKLSTVVYVLFIIAAAVAAPTANEDFVIAEDAQTYTNAVNAANQYTDAATNAIPRPDFSTNNAALVATIEATASTPGNYEAVSNAAMNAVQLIGIHAVSLISVAGTSIDPIPCKRVNWNNTILFGAEYDGVYYRTIADNGRWYMYGDDDSLIEGSVSGWDIGSDDIVITFRESDDTEICSYLGYRSMVARLGDIPSTNDLASASELRGVVGSVTTLAGQVATIGAHLNAEDARFVVTNYNSVTHTPEAYVEIKLPDDSWSRIWSEMTRWNYLYDIFLPTNYYDKAAVNAALADKADRAWGFYDSTTGEYAPDGYTWISSEKIAIAANLAYQRTITSEGAIWVLESNGVVTETGGMTNGFFRISDDEGNSLFEIVKGNKRTIGADASSCQIVAGFTPTKLQIGYSVVGPQPVIYVCNSLVTQNWKAETESDCIANVSWSGESGAWVAQVQGKTAQSALFVKATYEVGGETYINNTAPVSMQYIMLNGVKYAVGTATISGNTVLTLTVAP